MFLVLMLFGQPAHLVMDLLRVLYARKQDSDPVGIILEIHSFIVQNEEDLSVCPERMLFAFSPHGAVPLLLCGCRIVTVIPEDAQRLSSRSGSSVGVVRLLTARDSGSVDMP